MAETGLPRADARYRFWLPLGRLILSIIGRLKFGCRIRKFKEEGDRPYLFLMNHTTVWDQFFITVAVRQPVYFVCTEDILSNGWVSRLIRYFVDPIAIRKQTTDLRAVMDITKIAKAGGSIGMAPEGNRTYSGRTCHINPAVGKLAKVIGLPVALFRIEGGYGVHPRWSDVTRRGRMDAGVVRVIEPEELKAMKPAQVAEVIRKELTCDEACVSGTFRSRKKAEYLERCFYTCPDCGLTRWESRGNRAVCLTCGRTILYGETKEIAGEDRPFPYRFAADWYDAQCRFVSGLPADAYLETPAFTDEASVKKVILYERKEKVADRAKVFLYSDRLEAELPEGRRVFSFGEIGAVTVLGRNKMNVYAGDEVLQFKGGKRFNALKYVNFFHHWRNLAEAGAGNGGKEEKEDGEFLGL